MATTQNDDEDRLARQVNRVVTAPYAVSLKDLHDLTQEIRKKNEHPRIIALRRWADANPCQVDALAASILDGLDQWPYTLEILAPFASSSKPFRDAVLQLQPALLDDLIRKAVNGDQKVFDTCISLLSYPLPEGIATPACLPSFVQKTMENMVQNPCSRALKSLYWLIHGIRGTLLEVLPAETLVNFLTECKKTLRNLDDHMGNLFCLATLAKIAYPFTNGAAAPSPDDQKEEVLHQGTPVGQESKSLATETSQDESDGDKRPPWLCSILQFFGSKYGTKTLDLVVVRAILGIQLGKDICGAIEPEQRNAWARSNGKKLVKLCEKVLRPEIDPRVQIMGMVFLVSLLEVEVIPQEIVALAQETLQSPSWRRYLSELPEDLVQLVVTKISPRFDQKSLKAVIQIISSTLDGPNTANVPSITNVRVSSFIATALFTSMQSSESVKSSIVSVLLGAPGQELYKQVMAFNPKIDGNSCESSFVCSSALSNAQHKLYTDISALFLGSYLALPANHQPVAAAHSSAYALLSALTRNVNEKKTRFSCCPSSLPHNTQRFDFFTFFPRARDSSSLPHSTHLLNHHPSKPSHSWKDTLAEDLLRDAQQSHKAIIQRVSAVCRDLEDRCDNVEGPVRNLGSKLDQITVECKLAQERNSALERESDERSETIATLKNDNSKLEQQVQSFKTRAEDLSTRLRSVEKDLEDLKRRSKKELTNTKEKTREMELEYLATLTSRDDTIDELHQKIAGLNTHFGDLRGQLAAASGEKAEVQLSLKSMESELAESKRTVDAKDAMIMELQEEIARLRADKDYMRSITDRLQSKLDETAEESKALKNELRDQEQTYQKEYESFKREQSENNSKFTLEIKEQKKIHKEDLRKLQTALHDTEIKAAQKVRDRDTRIESLEQKIAQLRQERISKAREFAEAQDLSTRLMAIMDKKNFDHNESQPVNTTKNTSHLTVPTKGSSATGEGGDTEEEEFKTQVSSQGPVDSFPSSNSTNPRPAPKRSKSSRDSNRRSLGARSVHTFDDNAQGKTAVPPAAVFPGRQLHEESNPGPTKSTSKEDGTRPSSKIPEGSQDPKPEGQFNSFDTDEDSYNYGDLDSLGFLEDVDFTSTPM